MANGGHHYEKQNAEVIKMRVCIRGIRELDFRTAEGDVKGTQIFFSHPSDGVVGEKTDKIFICAGFPLPPELAPGKTVDMFFDKGGRVEHLSISTAGK